MAKFSILVVAENLDLPVEVEGEARIARGFLVWRSVDAQSEDMAKQQALESVRGDPKMAGIAWSAADGPRLKIREVHEVESWSSSLPGSGYIFI